MNDRTLLFQQATQLFNRILSKFQVLENKPRNFGTGDLLSRSEIHVLAGIDENPLVSVTDLAGKLGVTKGAISQMVGKLSGKGYVRKLQSVDDRKEILLALTEKGQVAAENHDDFHKRMFELYCSDLSIAEIKIFLNILKRIEKFTDDHHA
jgi:DNA-binding MarR family transcriptional regulator